MYAEGEGGAASRKEVLSSAAKAGATVPENHKIETDASIKANVSRRCGKTRFVRNRKKDMECFTKAYQVLMYSFSSFPARKKGNFLGAT